MEEVLPQDIISGKKYYVEYWGRENNRGHTDPTQPHVLLKKYYGRIDEEDRGVLALRDAIQIKNNGEKIRVINDPFITVKPENPITFEQEQKRREDVNYYYKFFKYNDYYLDDIKNKEIQHKIPSLQTLAYRQLSTNDLDNARKNSNLINMYEPGKLGGKKRKTKRKKSKKRKTKKNKSKRKKV